MYANLGSQASATTPKAISAQFDRPENFLLGRSQGYATCNTIYGTVVKQCFAPHKMYKTPSVAAEESTIPLDLLVGVVPHPISFIQCKGRVFGVNRCKEV